MNQASQGPGNIRRYELTGKPGGGQGQATQPIDVGLLSRPTLSFDMTRLDQTFVPQCIDCGLRRREERGAIACVCPGAFRSFQSIPSFSSLVGHFLRDILIGVPTNEWVPVCCCELCRHFEIVSKRHLRRDCDPVNLRALLRIGIDDSIHRKGGSTPHCDKLMCPS